MPAQTTEGFTIVELLLYTAVASVLIGSIATLMASTHQTKAKLIAITEVESVGLQISQLLSTTVKNSQTIITPTVAATSSILTLNTYLASTTPSTIQITDDTLSITQGTHDPLAFSSGRLIISNLLFENVSATSTADSIRSSFTLRHADPSDKSEYSYEQTFYVTASTR